MKFTTPFSRKKQNAFLEAIRNATRVFWGPDPALCREMKSGDFFKPFESLIEFFDSETVKNLQDVKSRIEKIKTQQILYEQLEETYVRLFVSTRGKIIPLYHSCYEYEDAPLMGRPAAMMKKRLCEKGLDVAAEMREPPDHLAIELEYLYFLLDRGWHGTNKACLSEAGAFAANDMLPWISVFSEKLSWETREFFYPPFSTVLAGCLKAICFLK